MSDQYLEAAAKAEHDQWVRWAGKLMETEELSQERIDRWAEYMVPYDVLPDEVKEADRKEARLSIGAWVGDRELYEHRDIEPEQCPSCRASDSSHLGECDGEYVRVSVEGNDCVHEWVDATNEVVSNMDWCRKCGAVRAQVGNET